MIQKCQASKNLLPSYEGIIMSSAIIPGLGNSFPNTIARGGLGTNSSKTGYKPRGGGPDAGIQWET